MTSTKNVRTRAFSTVTLSNDNSAAILSVLVVVVDVQCASCLKLFSYCRSIAVLICCLFIVVSRVSGNNSPDGGPVFMSPEPDNVTVETGETATLICRFYSDLPTKVQVSLASAFVFLYNRFYAILSLKFKNYVHCHQVKVIWAGHWCLLPRYGGVYTLSL